MAKNMDMGLSKGPQIKKTKPVTTSMAPGKASPKMAMTGKKGMGKPAKM